MSFETPTLIILNAPRRSRLLFGALLLVLCGVAHGQDAVQPLPEPSVPAPDTAINAPVAPAGAVTPETTNDANFQPVQEPGAAGYAPQPRRLQYAFQLSARGVYDDNINLSHSNPQSDLYFAIEPTVTVGFGDVFGKTENYIRLDYEPSLLIFLDHSSRDAVQHLIRIEGNHRFRRLELTLVQDVQILDGTDVGTIAEAGTPGTRANVDVAGPIRANYYVTQINARYDLTGKTSVSAGLHSTVHDYPNLISSQVISANAYLNYQYSEKIGVGLGGVGGYDLVDAPNPDQTFEQANVRLTYQASGKVSVNASGGVEFRQFEHGARSQYVSPVFEIGATYQPFDGTNFAFNLTRRIFNSAVLAGQDYTATLISVAGRQRLYQRTYVGLAIGYQNADYFSTLGLSGANRSDNYYYLEPALDVMITRFWTVGAYYLHRQDESSFDQFSFDNNQVGLRTVLTF